MHVTHYTVIAATAISLALSACLETTTRCGIGRELYLDGRTEDVDIWRRNRYRANCVLMEHT